MNEVLSLPPVVETPTAGPPLGEMPSRAATPNVQGEPKVYDITSMAGEVSPDAVKATMLGASTEAGANEQPRSNASYASAGESGAQQGNGQSWYNTYLGDAARNANFGATRSAESGNGEVIVGLHEAIAAGLGRLAVNPNLGQTNARKTPEVAKKEVAPTNQEMLDGLTNDLIANADLADDDPRGLTGAQRYGVVRRLYETVKTLGGEKEIKRLDSFVTNADAINADNKAWGNERAWIKEAQGTVVKLLGGMPRELKDKSVIFNNVRRYYNYSPATSKDHAAWNPRGTLYTMTGQRRIGNMRRGTQSRKRYGLAS